MSENNLPTSSANIIKLQFEGIPLSCPIENGHPLIPVKVICHMIDVDFMTQYSWVKKDEILGQLYRISYTVGLDGKQREMMCLSVFDMLF